MTREEILSIRLGLIRELIAVESSARGDASAVEVVAVTKAASDNDFLAMSSLHLPLAENRWEKLSARLALLGNAGKGIPFHFIGALQRRSTKDKGFPVNLISSVDRENILPILNQMALQYGVFQNILVELDLSGIPGRSGVSPESLPVLLDAISQCGSLVLKGLLVMGVPPSPSGDLSETIRIFDGGRRLFDWLSGQCSTVDTLSMGMSGDYLEAVRAGSTQVRLGTILFGKEEIIGRSHPV